jgi:hypothetical protein
MDIRIKGPRDFFDHVVAPSYESFIEGDPTPFKVFSMASALYNVTGWVYLYHEDDIRAKFGTFITTANQLWRHVEYLVPHAGVIRDLNQCGHYVRLDYDPNRQRLTNPLTGMPYAANTFVTITSDKGVPYRPINYDEPEDDRMDESSGEFALEPIATEVYRFWKDLVDVLYPPAASTAG